MASGVFSAVVVLVKVTRRANAQWATRAHDTSATVDTRVARAEGSKGFTVSSSVTQGAVTSVITLLWISL